MIDAVGASNVIQIDLYRDNCNFNNDSRNYYELCNHNMLTVSVFNNSTIESVMIEINSIFALEGWIK